LHRESDRYTAKDGLSTWNLVGNTSLVNSCSLVKGEDLFLRKQHIFDTEEFIKIDNVECEFRVQRKRFYGDH